jgi:hypothetical protein
VFENRVSRRIFAPERDGVTGEWRKLHNEELNDMYCLHSIVRVIKSTRMRWAGHVARMERDEVPTELYIRYHYAKYTTARADVNICQYGTVQ